MKKLQRGEIYYITFPHTFDSRYSGGKSKFVLVLQEGDYFKKYDTVEILLITSDKEFKSRDQYPTDVPIDVGTTKLTEKSWVCCAQPYPIRKALFDEAGVWRAGKLSAEKMDEVDEALYNGLCMGLQHELEVEVNEELKDTGTES